jgi:hypothetical protein
MTDKILSKVDTKTPRLRCALAIKAANRREFGSAFKELIKQRSKDINEHKISNEVDHLLFIEGLALLRLATLNGIKTGIDHPLVPSHLQITHDKSIPDHSYLKISPRELETLRKKLGNNSQRR